MTWLENSWMNNPTFLAEMAHFAWAYGIILTAAVFGLGGRGLARLALAFMAFVLVKEFWYDLRFELPNDTLAGSAVDFGFYMLGIGVAFGCLRLQLAIMRRRFDLALKTARIEIAPRNLRLYQPEEESAS